MGVAVLRDVCPVTGLRCYLRSFAQEFRSTYISQDLVQLISLLRLVRLTAIEATIAQSTCDFILG